MSQSKKAVFSIAYFPPVHFFSEICNTEEIIIEQHENYIKQSYRNRCEILSSNGKQTLSIPVQKKSGEKQLIKDIKIDYKNNWQSIHFKSLEAAYLSSPFYEFYIDSFIPFFEKKYTFLFDFNLEIIKKILSELQLEKQIRFNDNFQKEYNFRDFRETIHPKKDIQIFFPKYTIQKYIQVFSDKYPFIPNLSILDLLFNEGPNTENLLIS
jgi:hypothetical protein